MIEYQAKVDAAVVSATISAPWWLPYFDHSVHILLALGGLLLLVLRIGIAWREWQAKKRGE
jgi:hypothetical protein